jgi:flagellar P-ring protein FlgI
MDPKLLKILLLAAMAKAAKVPPRSGYRCLLAASLAAVLLLPVRMDAQTRLGDLLEVQHAQQRELIGYGLVTGLDRSGDRASGTRGAVFTVQSIANMLDAFGIAVDPEQLRTRNVAAVMVTATIGPYHAPGSAIDVTISSLGDASSLQGGVLLQTPLFDPDNPEISVKAQGPLVVGGISAEMNGTRVSQNPTLTAIVPNGGTVQANPEFTIDTSLPLGLVLRSPNYTNARRIVEQINQTFDENLAMVKHPGLVEIALPAAFQSAGEVNTFLSIVMEQRIVVDTPARVVINERTGTIVAGGNVIIDNVMIAHGSVQIRTQVTPFVSQPAPFSEGTTVEGQIEGVEITESAAQTLILPAQTNVQQLAAALNQLGLSPRDIIAIFQAIDRAGALRARLIVM